MQSFSTQTIQLIPTLPTKSGEGRCSLTADSGMIDGSLDTNKSNHSLDQTQTTRNRVFVCQCYFLLAKSSTCLLSSKINDFGEITSSVVTRSGSRHRPLLFSHLKLVLDFFTRNGLTVITTYQLVWCPGFIVMGFYY